MPILRLLKNTEPIPLAFNGTEGEVQKVLSTEFVESHNVVTTRVDRSGKVAITIEQKYNLCTKIQEEVRDTGN